MLIKEEISQLIKEIENLVAVYDWYNSEAHQFQIRIHEFENKGLEIKHRIRNKMSDLYSLDPANEYEPEINI